MKKIINHIDSKLLHVKILNQLFLPLSPIASLPIYFLFSLFLLFDSWIFKTIGFGNFYDYNIIYSDGESYTYIGFIIDSIGVFKSFIYVIARCKVF